MSCEYQSCWKFQSRKQDYFNWKPVFIQSGMGTGKFQSRKQDYFNWKASAKSLLELFISCFSPASRIILIESPNTSNTSKVSIMQSFSPASRIILIESHSPDFYQHFKPRFQSRKQDYFNWKDSHFKESRRFLDPMFQSRKQDYFNWKASVAWVSEKLIFEVSVPQAGLF